MRLNKHCLRVENDLDAYERLRWTVRVVGQATLMYDVRTHRLLVLEGFESGGGSIIALRAFSPADLPTLTLQLIYDELAMALEQRWELSWVNG